jgi:hypothetical protein
MLHRSCSTAALGQAHHYARNPAFFKELRSKPLRKEDSFTHFRKSIALISFYSRRDFEIACTTPSVIHSLLVFHEQDHLLVEVVRAAFVRVPSGANSAVGCMAGASREREGIDLGPATTEMGARTYLTEEHKMPRQSLYDRSI